MHSRSCTGTSLRGPASLNTVLNVFTKLSSPKNNIEIAASFHITLKMKIIPRRNLHAHDVHFCLSRSLHPRLLPTTSSASAWRAQLIIFGFIILVGFQSSDRASVIMGVIMLATGCLIVEAGSRFFEKRARR
jgi:hypothetical protein